MGRKVDYMIKFIEKERYYDDSPFIGHCYYYPTYMIKDGKEYFVFNRREPDDKWKLEENEAHKNQLIKTDGKYFRFHSFYENPVEMLKEIIERKHHFTTPNKMYYGCIEGNGYLDFQGNRKEVSAAFHYRIYDEKLAMKIQEIVKKINSKKWSDEEAIVKEIE